LSGGDGQQGRKTGSTAARHAAIGPSGRCINLRFAMPAACLIPFDNSALPPAASGFLRPKQTTRSTVPTTALTKFLPRNSTDSRDQDGAPHGGHCGTQGRENQRLDESAAFPKVRKESGLLGFSKAPILLKEQTFSGISFGRKSALVAAKKNDSPSHPDRGKTDEPIVRKERPDADRGCSHPSSE
jgi:hypothetical protein